MPIKKENLMTLFTRGFDKGKFLSNAYNLSVHMHAKAATKPASVSEIANSTGKRGNLINFSSP